LKADRSTENQDDDMHSQFLAQFSANKIADSNTGAASQIAQKRQSKATAKGGS